MTNHNIHVTKYYLVGNNWSSDDIISHVNKIVILLACTAPQINNLTVTKEQEQTRTVISITSMNVYITASYQAPNNLKLKC